MRLELELSEGGGSRTASDLPPIRLEPRRPPRLDRFDAFVLALFGLVSLFVLALDLWRVVFDGRVWTGTDGVYIVDQMQYLAWIKDASHHLLASNLFVLRPTPHDYFQPAVVISGGLTAIGVPAWVSLLVWKPVAVVAFFFAVRALVVRVMGGLWARRVALVLALFFGSFTTVYGNFSVLGDLFPGFLSWGYVFGLMALAAMVWALVAYADVRVPALADRAPALADPAVNGDGRGAPGRVVGAAEWRSWLGGAMRELVRWRTWLPGALGALATLLHPWNGELLIALVVAAELVMLAGRRYGLRHLPLTAATLVGTGIALLYYAILGKADLNWKLAQVASKHAFSFWSITLALVPLLVPALIAYTRRPTTFLAAVTRTWPVAAFGIFVLSGTSLGATPLHAFQGITIPLAVLAVEGLQLAGWHRVKRPMLVGGVAVLLFTIPATAYEFKVARHLSAPTPNNANFIRHDERSAITYLAHAKQPGTVMARSYLGAAVPGRTGRHTYVGDCLWSEPGCLTLTNNAQNLFDGALKPAAARSFVLSSGARFVLADCQTTADMRKLLGPIIRSARSFGCAAVYEVE